VYHEMDESPTTMGYCRARNSSIGAGSTDSAGCSYGEQRWVGGLSAGVGGDREARGSTAGAANLAARVLLAGGMSLAAAELDGDGNAQRSAGVAGVSDRQPGVGVGVPAAVGGVAVEGIGSGLARFGGAQPLYRGLGRLMEEASRLALVGLGLVWLVLFRSENLAYNTYHKLLGWLKAIGGLVKT
jgi:hypothetical protein